jgi:C4-type Zn-finger protein
MKRILYVQHADGKREMTCPNCKTTKLEFHLEAGHYGDDYQYAWHCEKCGWKVTEHELDVIERHEKQVKSGYGVK